jgi:hypothetical protein
MLGRQHALVAAVRLLPFSPFLVRGCHKCDVSALLLVGGEEFRNAAFGEGVGRYSEMVFERFVAVDYLPVAAPAENGQERWAVVGL